MGSWSLGPAAHPPPGRPNPDRGDRPAVSNHAGRSDPHRPLPGPLRDRGVAIIGSGGIVHNLRAIHLSSKEAPVDAWAKEFDAWFTHHLAARDFTTLARYRELAPHAGLAVPTSEHFEPVFVTLGASRETDPLTTIYEGFHYGNLSMRTFAFG